MRVINDIASINIFGIAGTPSNLVLYQCDNCQVSYISVAVPLIQR